jgi:hypothetical protein
VTLVTLISPYLRFQRREGGRAQKCTKRVTSVTSVTVVARPGVWDNVIDPLLRSQSAPLSQSPPRPRGGSL